MTSTAAHPEETSASETGHHRVRRLWILTAVVLTATLLGLIESSQVQYDRAVQGAPITWGHALMHGLPRWYLWALLAPAVLILARRIHRLRLGLVLTMLTHLIVAAVVTVAHVAMFAMISNLWHGGPDPVGHFRPALLKYMGLTFFGNVMTYGVLVGGWYGLQLYRRYREREKEARRLELQTSELKALLAESQLQRLQAQIEPHFLFNSLHTLSSLILQGDSTEAIRMTRRLSDLLRRSLRAGESAEHSLDEELDLVREYLAIQQVRFEDRLDVRLEIDPAAADALVPALLLQPLVENAIRHGIEADPQARRVEVRVEFEERDRARLRLVVRNEGPPLGGSSREGAGLGLKNTRGRLRAMYGDEAGLEIVNAEGGGVVIEVVIPYRGAAAAITSTSSTGGAR